MKALLLEALQLYFTAPQDNLVHIGFKLNIKIQTYKHNKFQCFEGHIEHTKQLFAFYT